MAHTPSDFSRVKSKSLVGREHLEISSCVLFCCSILGMHIFGCKFSLKTEAGDTVPDRKNFDSLLWAIVTVFQVAQHAFLDSAVLSSLCFAACVLCSNPMCSHPVDPDSGGLERGVVQRHGFHLALRFPVFRSPYDFRELCAVQFAGGHLG